jgi:ABC-2 type transport system permease protein
MRKLWVMIRKELREGIATRSFVIGTLLTPVLIGALMIIPEWLSNRSKDTTYKIAILEVDTRRVEGFSDFVAADTLPGGRPQWSIEYSSVPANDTGRTINEWTVRALKNDLDAFLVVDASVWDTSDVPMYSSNVSRTNMVRELRTRFTDFIVAGRTATQGINAALARQLTRRVELETHKVGAEGRSKSAFMSDYFGALIFVMLLFTMIFGYGTQLMRALFEEKSARIIEVLVSSVTPFQIMMSKIIGQGMVAMAQILAWVLMGLVLIAGGSGLVGRMGDGLAILGSLSFVLWFTVYLLLGYFLYSCWFALVGAIVSSEQEAQPLVAPIVMILIFPVIAMLSVINEPNSSWIRVLSIIPPLSPPAMVMRMNLTSVPLWEILLSVTLLILAVIGAGWIVARIFRIGILMTGKRPTLPEVLRWIRYT